MHDSIHKIGDHAFDRCTKLTGSLILPAFLNSLGEGAFYMCEGFTGTLSIPLFFHQSFQNIVFINAQDSMN